MSDMTPAAFSEDVALIQKFHSATGPYCVVCPGDSAGEQPDCEHRPRWCVKCEGVEWPCFTRMAADRLAAHRCAPSVAAPPREDESPGTRLSRESIELHRAEQSRGGDT